MISIQLLTSFLLIFCLKKLNTEDYVLNRNNEQKCKCLIIERDVKIDKNFKVLRDFSTDLPIQNGFNSIKELDECEIRCRNRLSEYFQYEDLNDLNKTFFDIYESNMLALNNLCERIGKRILRPGVEIFVRIERNTNFHTKELFLGNLCCNLACSCVIKSKIARHNQVIVNFNTEITNKTNIAYECENELVQCETECRSILSKYLDYKEIADITNQNDVDLFEQNNKIGDFMCGKFDTKDIMKPGVEVYARLETGANNAGNNGIIKKAKNVYLGRLCCNKKCSCDIVTNDASLPNLMNRTTHLVNLNAFIPTTDPYYTCDEESKFCLIECRKAAALYFKNQKFSNLNLPLSNVDALATFDTAVDICQIIFKDVAEPGYNIYLRYGTNLNQYSLIDDLFIGRICCKKFGNGYLPFNKCKTLIFP